MLFKSLEHLSCDVLVIGGGGAGLRSAIAARLRGADVLLAAKTRIGPVSNTYLSKAVIAAAGWGTPDDAARVHVEDTMQAGRFLNDPAMVARMAERSPAEITFLRDCGVDFAMDGDRLRLIRIAGHRHPRHVHGAGWRGSDLVLPLRRRAEAVGVRMAEQVFVSRLLSADGRICGAAGITPDGRFLAIQAKAVVLATGGYAQVFRNTNNAPGITGDGPALAHDLGLPLKDMEFVQFYPTAAGRRGSRLILYENMLSRPGVALRNGKGENILERHGIADPMTVTRDRLAQIITREIREAASPEPGVFMDMTDLSEETARELSAILPPRWWQGQKVFQVAPTAHFCMGGIATDPSGETPLAGLFAVGEAAAGMHGANRLGGNALAEIFAMGSFVGETAAAQAMAIGAFRVPGKGFEEERSRLAAAFSREGMGAKQAVEELKALMWKSAGVIRCESGLSAALKHLAASAPRITVSTPAELIRRLEYENMRCVARMVCRAALERTESRGAHFRSDFPEEDNPAWRKNIVLRKNPAGLSVETRSVRVDRMKSGG